MHSETTTNKWKQKAIQRSTLLRKLRKQLREVEASRLKWRRRYRSLKKQQAALVEQKPLAHHYRVVLIWLSLQVYNHCCCWLRSCCEMVVSTALVLQLKCRRPCAATIRKWVVKYGYSCAHCDPPAQQGPWVVFTDESVAIGQQRLLLILGLPLQGWGFEHPVQDVGVLHRAVAASWKADTIEPILKSLPAKQTIAYCVCDKGNNIMGAVRQRGWRHVYDCSHPWARLLEKLYAQQQDFCRFTKATAALRRKWNLSR